MVWHPRGSYIVLSLLWNCLHRKLNQLIKAVVHVQVRLTSGPYCSRMQLTLRATCQTPHGAPRLVQALSAWSMKTRHAPFRHCSDARVYGHTTTSMHEIGYIAPIEYTPPPYHHHHQTPPPPLHPPPPRSLPSPSPISITMFFPHSTSLLTRPNHCYVQVVTVLLKHRCGPTTAFVNENGLDLSRKMVRHLGNFSVMQVAKLLLLPKYAALQGKRAGACRGGCTRCSCMAVSLYDHI